MLLALSPLLYLGLGFILLFAACGLGRGAYDWRPPFFLGMAAVYATGVLLAYLFVLVAPGLREATWASVALAAIGWVIFLRYSRRFSFSASRGQWAFFLLLLFFYGGKMLAEPVRDWDARSIWFFQAKIILYGNGLNLDWQNPLYRFANLDYPKFFPALIAQNAYLLGYWNEFLPRIGLLHLFVPLAAAMTYLSSRRWSFLFYFMLAFLMPGSWMWNGYLDIYLGLFCALGLLFLWRARAGRAVEILPGIVFVLLAMHLKKEGSLVIAAAACAWFVYARLWAAPWRSWSRPPVLFYRLFALGAVLLLPFLCWEWKRRSLALTNQLLEGSVGLPEVWRKIVEDGALQNITLAILVEGKVIFLLALAAVMMLMARIQKIKIPREGLFVLVFTLAYLPFIYAILILSPLQQHLYESMRVNMNRVPLTVLETGFAFLFLLMARLLGEEEVGT